MHQELVNLIKCGFNNSQEKGSTQTSTWSTLGAKCKLSKTLKRLHTQQEQERREQEEREQELIEKESKIQDGSKSLPSILVLSMNENKALTQVVTAVPPPPPSSVPLFPVPMRAIPSNPIVANASKKVCDQFDNPESSASSISSLSGSGSSTCTIVCKNVNTVTSSNPTMVKQELLQQKAPESLSMPKTNEPKKEIIEKTNDTDAKLATDNCLVAKPDNHSVTDTLVIKRTLHTSLNLNKKKYSYFNSHRIKSATITTSKAIKPPALPETKLLTSSNKNATTITTTTTTTATTTSNFMCNLLNKQQQQQQPKSFIRSGFSTLRHSVSFNLKCM